MLSWKAKDAGKMDCSSFIYFSTWVVRFPNTSELHSKFGYGPFAFHYEGQSGTWPQNHDQSQDPHSTWPRGSNTYDSPCRMRLRQGFSNWVSQGPSQRYPVPFPGEGRQQLDPQDCVAARNGRVFFRTCSQQCLGKGASKHVKITKQQQAILVFVVKLEVLFFLLFLDV